MKQLQQRTWFIHWSLFVFFNHQAGRSGIIDVFLNEKYIPLTSLPSSHLSKFFISQTLSIFVLCSNMTQRYLSTIQANCPHILRYLAAAVILNKKKRNMLKEIVKVSRIIFCFISIL
jgi:translation initiation factor 3 subunit E